MYLNILRLRNGPGQPGTVRSGFRSGSIQVEVFQGPDQDGPGWPAPEPGPGTRRVAKSPPSTRRPAKKPPSYNQVAKNILSEILYK
jgi:hypothetical protein